MSAAAVPQRWPLVGRRGELERFTFALGDAGSEGVVFHGEAGVGKTRLADECRRAAELAGHPTVRAVASRTAAAVPLGALAHLLPAPPAVGAPVDPVQLFHDARLALAGAPSSAPSPRVVLLVDDVHLLDATSAMLVSQLLASGVVFLVGTVRSGEPVPDAVSSLWRDERVARVDVQPLVRTSVDTLLHRALGAPLDAAALDTLWDDSRGNALVLRELANGAIATGALTNVDGVWRLDGVLPRTTQLVELVESRLGSADDEQRRLLELLAWCEPVSRDDAVAAASEDALEALERRNLVMLAVDGRRTNVTLAHPLYGDVLRAAQPLTAAHRMLVEHAKRVEAHGLRRREDGPRVTTWRLDAGTDVDPQRLVDAALLARHAHDYRQVERLAGAAWASRASFASGLLLGEAHYELGSFEEAELVLDRAATLASGDDELLRATVARTTNLFWGLLRHADALAVNRAAQTVVVQPDVRRQLVVDEASLAMFSGAPGEALALLDTIDDDQHDDARAAVERAIVLSPALAVTGRTERAIDVARDGWTRHSEMGDLIAIAHPGTHVVNEVLALTEAGRLDDATTLASAGYDVAVAQRVPITQIWFALNLARIALIRGLPATSERWFRTGTALARATGFDGPREMALRGLAVTRAYVGDGEGAAATVAEIDGLRASLGFMRHEAALARAWTRVAGADVAGGCRVLLDAAADALASGHRTSAAWLLHDVARLGDAPAALGLVEADLRECESTLVGVRIAHIEAAARSDAAGLAAVVDDLERAGLPLAAAEAATAAADAYRAGHDARAAAAMATRAAALASRCEGARTPGLVAPEAVVPLSRREREIALLAAEGVQSKEIATRLFVSVRTVNNHLQNAYTKLGVSGRAELARALRLASESTGGAGAETE